METLQALWERSEQTLSLGMDRREAAQVLAELFRKFAGMNKLQLHLHGDRMADQQLNDMLSGAIERIRLGEPLQYITGEAFFYHQTYYVDEHVLIPRPETEELVEWIIADHRNNPGPVRILDIGTGSGCIAISLSRYIPGSKVWALDKDPAALTVAKKNNRSLESDVKFIQADILQSKDLSWEGAVDVIVSNPPYIVESERERMTESVTAFEPALALFATHPLEFYESIAAFAGQHLAGGGKLYFELNEFHAEAVRDLMESLEYDDVRLKKDMQGKDRMLRCIKP